MMCFFYERRSITMKFDLISDVHLDELLQGDLLHQSIPRFVQSILPATPSKLLVFAGDFGFYNFQNIEFLHELKKTYDVILYVYGNNDTKLNLHVNIEDFTDAKERIKAFEEEVKHISGVYHLDGTTFEWEGCTFGGSNIFFDFNDLKKQFGFTDAHIQQCWKDQRLHIKHQGYIDDPYVYSTEEKDKLRRIFRTSDVIITHGSPDYFIGDDKVKGFFRFDGDEFISQLPHKLWCFGHQHQRMLNHTYNGCRFYNASYLGTNSPQIVTVEYSPSCVHA